MIFPIVIGDIRQPTNGYIQIPTTLEVINKTQTESIPTLHVTATGAQYSSPSDRSDSSSSDSDSDIEGTEKITVAKRYLHRHLVSS